MPAAASLQQVFDANRSSGRIALSVHAANGATRRTRVAEDGSLRIRFPESETQNLQAMIVNTAGGIAGGDRHRIDIVAAAGARVTVTTAAAEKIYRSLGPSADIEVLLRVAPGARLCWLPQETILFDRAHLNRRIEIDLTGDASLLMAEAAVFGRRAMGEDVRNGVLHDRWRLRRDGKLIFADALRLDGSVAARLAETAIAAGGCAVATVLSSPVDEAAVERVRSLADGFSGDVAISAWNGLAVARLCAKDSAGLRGDLATVLTALGGELPRLWIN